MLALSTRAMTALRKQEACWQRLRANVEDIVAVDIPTIEELGGGSVRCMLAEIPTVRA